MSLKGNGNEKQRFSLRKLNCGLVSVLVGMAFFGPVAFSSEVDGEKTVTTETTVQLKNKILSKQRLILKRQKK